MAWALGRWLGLGRKKEGLGLESGEELMGSNDCERGCGRVVV